MVEEYPEMPEMGMVLCYFLRNSEEVIAPNKELAESQEDLPARL
ncbi:hypothetical protein AM1_C0354 (plasmid) [Acaryochloris marina MBIC11017]|uniref:Uncharacterized protein n=1 Tax=Acaryochloris marina (strain MBIC 11017) TaxID=329726 RepID=A8ZN82_ACAM1|nr:hypothetical protein AM1_C0354 [Acaryochloris marina MBIC11017]